MRTVYYWFLAIVFMVAIMAFLEFLSWLLQNYITVGSHWNIIWVLVSIAGIILLMRGIRNLVLASLIWLGIQLKNSSVNKAYRIFLQYYPILFLIFYLIDTFKVSELTIKSVLLFSFSILLVGNILQPFYKAVKLYNSIDNVQR